MTKNVIGTPPANAQYDVQLVCAGPGPAYVATHTFNAGESYTFDVPANAGVISGPGVCTVAELPPPGAPQTSVVTFPVLSGIMLLGSDDEFGFANGNGGRQQVGIENDQCRRTSTGHGEQVHGGRFPAGTPFLVLRIKRPMTSIRPHRACRTTTSWPSARVRPRPSRWICRPVTSSARCQEINSGGATSVTYASGPAAGHAAERGPEPRRLRAGQLGDAQRRRRRVRSGEHRQHVPAEPQGRNTLRIKKQLRGRIPAGATFTIRVRCTGGGITDVRDLTFTTNSFQEIAVSSARTDCRVTEIANGGAQSVSYFASSATADATDGPNSARIDFGNTVGGRAARSSCGTSSRGPVPDPDRSSAKADLTSLNTKQ